MSETIQSYQASQMNEKKRKIMKHSRRISVIIGIGKYLAIFCTIIFATISTSIITGVISLDHEIDFFSALIDIIMPLNRLIDFFDEENALILTYGIASFLALVITIQLAYLQRTIHQWSKGSSPFQDKYIIGMRKLAIAGAITMTIFQPLFIIFGMVLFVFTYLMAYGNVLERSADERIKSHEQMVLSLAEIIESKSGQTGLHVKRVSEYSRVIAEGFGLPEEVVDEIRIASMLHDIGKLLIPIDILEKPGKLTDEEFEEIKKHTKYGYELLANTRGPVLKKAVAIASEHHEKWDGTGYNGKQGIQISVAARIVAVADVYDALVSKRSYKEPWTPDEARLEIERCSGSHFDPEVVEVFCKQYVKICEIMIKYKDS